MVEQDPPSIPPTGPLRTVCKSRSHPDRCHNRYSHVPQKKKYMDFPHHFLPLLAAALVVGMSKGGLASAAAIAVPMLALIMDPVRAAAILLPVFIATDAVAVWAYRHDYSAINLKILIPAILAGTLTATLVIPYTPESILLIFTGAIGLWYCWRTWFTKNGRTQREARVGPGLFWGWLTGIASFITHSGAPPSQAFLLPQQLPRLTFAGTIAMAFAVGNLSKLPGYYVLGQLQEFDWKLTAVLIVAGAAGTFLGRWLIKRINDALFVKIVEGLLLLLSVLLVLKGARMLMTGSG